MKENREFKLNKDGNISITVDSNGAEVFLPIDGKNQVIGTAITHTEQTITDPETFVAFLKSQQVDSEIQLAELEKRYETLKDVKDDMIPESVLSDVASYMARKDNKQLKKRLTRLNHYFEQVYTKRQLEHQIKNMAKINIDLKEQNAKIDAIFN